MKERRRTDPLDNDALRRFAVSYVGRYATTRAKLAVYLKRKIVERGWGDDGDPDVASIVDHCVQAGYVDDAAFARMRSDALGRRGYGNRRIGAALSAAGIARDLAQTVQQDDDAAYTAAETYARKRRIGRFAPIPMDDVSRRRAFAAMLRAGHGFDLAKLFTQQAGEHHSDDDHQHE